LDKFRAKSSVISLQEGWNREIPGGNKCIEQPKTEIKQPNSEDRKVSISTANTG
jgi:hypothetical protein